MFIDDENTEAIAERIVKLLRGVELETMKDIIRRIRISGEISRTADYQLWRINQLSAFRGNYEKILKEALKLTDQELRKLYDEVIASGYARDKAIYDAANVAFIPFEDNIELQQLIEAVKRQTAETLDNITQTTGFINDKGVNVPLNRYFLDTMDTAHLEITTGTMSYDQSIKKAVNSMVRSGMRTDNNGDQWVNYDNPGKKPWRNRIDVATRRAVMTGIAQVTGKITDQNAEKLETEWFEVSAHPTARPTHMIWQGRVYTKEQLVTVCGLGTGPGLLGWNCYHHYDAFIPGISVRKYTEEELAKMRENAKKKTVYDGKAYTLYEATQQQRKYETAMRAQNQRIELLKAAGASRQEIAAEKAKRTAMYNKYRDFSKAFGLPEQINRVYYKESSPLIRQEFEDVTNEYKKAATPGFGVRNEQAGYDYEDRGREIDVADSLIRNLGGDVTLVTEVKGELNPDSIWRGKYWEFKDITSANSLNKQLQKGIHQIAVGRDGILPGGVVLDATNSNLSETKMIQLIKKRTGQSSSDNMDIMVTKNDIMIFVVRYNKKG